MKCPHCEIDLAPPKSNYNKNIYTTTPCCKKPIRYIPHLSWTVTKDRADQAAKSALSSRSLRRTNLIKRVVKDVIINIRGLRFVACGARQDTLNGNIDYHIFVNIPDNTDKTSIVTKLTEALHSSGVHPLYMEQSVGAKYQFKVSVAKLKSDQTE